MPHTRPKCKDDGGSMYFVGYASMGGSHSNYYKCETCNRVVEIYDRDLPYYDLDSHPQRHKKF